QGATLPEETRKGRRKKKKGNPQFNLREELFRMTGTDLTQIDGIDVVTAMTVVSEVGWDMSKWKTENHFVSWLKLSPDNKISGGGKIIKKGSATHQQPRGHGLKDGGHHFTGERHLFRGAVPPIPNSAKTSGGDQGHGRQTRPAPLPHVALRNEICRPRSRAL